MPMILRETKTISERGRITLSTELLRLAGLKIGDEVYFDITKSGNIVIKKYNKGEEKNG